MPMNNRLLRPLKTPGLLDLVPGAAAAYSLRSLSNSYAGPVVTVRRSTDDAEADFTASEVSDGTLAAWCGGGDGFVKQWWDQSGNARHATQATTGYQPQIVDSGVLVTEGGKAAVRFDGSDDYLAFTTPDSLKANAEKTIVSVSAGTGDSATYDFCVSTRAVGALTGYVYVVFTSNEDVRYAHVAAGNVDYTDAVINDSQAVLFLVTAANGGDVSLHVNGAVKSASVDTLTPAVAEPAGNETWIGKQSTAIAAMRMNELIFYPTDLTALRTRIEGNLAWYY